MDITKYILKFMDKHKDIIHMYHISSQLVHTLSLEHLYLQYTLCFDLFNSCTVSVHLYFVITGAHTLLGPDIVLYR